MKRIKRIPFELIFWTTALILLALAKPHVHVTEQHFTLCPLANMGFGWCPGCGIGRSITQLLHGNLAASFKYHWFGLPALMIICWRIVVLTRISLKNNKLLNLKY
ncbi:DUF2752 domain-containing protein [Pedobacter africanus]|uniref:DUF2752 domain-containing protein n=1 Tax=Pedobacter africanus TaxID=151894 RepID=A0A1W2B995_9SPHI|nr:DUF2752 domain-containing protein [Pedobacter africanus]SMC69557.1 Protein of unknown function [Pedobacter africanus]